MPEERIVDGNRWVLVDTCDLIPGDITVYGTWSDSIIRDPKFQGEVKEITSENISIQYLTNVYISTYNIRDNFGTTGWMKLCNYKDYSPDQNGDIDSDI